MYTDMIVNNSTTIATHMPILRQSMQRMAANMDQIAYEVAKNRPRMMDQLDTTERSLTNFLQAYHEGDRGIVKALKSIRNDIRNLKSLFSKADASAKSVEGADRVSRDIYKKARELQGKLDRLLARIDRIERKSGN